MKLKVENLAKIKEAEVNVKNLTLFVGQNSTNKSYIAHVIYELYKDLVTFNTPLRSSSKPFNENENALKENVYPLITQLLPNLEIKKISVETGSALLRIRLRKSKNLEIIIDKIFENILNNIKITINNSFNTKIQILEKMYFEYKIDDFMKKEIFIHENKEAEKTDSLIVANIAYKIYMQLIDSITANVKGYENIYFPASRSSYMLTIDAIYSGIFNNTMRGKSSFSKLTEPTIDFIEKFYEIKTNEDKKITDLSIKKLIEFLQNNIIKGKLVEEKNDFGHFIYYLETNNIKIDLQISSSMTLEVLPFIVFLKNIDDINKTFIVIEEPEAHLHPKAQIQMARFIVMLINSGAKVLVTTHSDYILGEINNCIKKYELKEDDISISKDNVSAYLFKNLENETQVKELPIDKFGISDENFEEALDELLEESGNLTDRLLENE